MSLRLTLAQLVNAGAFEIPVVAPCGSDNIHIAGVDVWQREEVTTVDGKGVHTTPRRNPSRGSVVTIRMWDEDGHDFRMVLLFHKGTVYTEVTPCQPAASRSRREGSYGGTEPSSPRLLALPKR